MPRPSTHSGGNKSRRHIGTPVPVKTKRDRQVPVLKVPCPECKADVEVKCVSLTTGEIMPFTRHRARRRMALRAGF